jgi:hypothetical protein
MIDTDLEVEIINAIESIIMGGLNLPRYKFKFKSMDFENYARVITFEDLLMKTEMQIRLK